MTFPVIHSTLDPTALTAEIERRYALPAPVRCRLISRANNDFYEVRASEARYALRVAKADFWPAGAYNYELDLTAHLATAGCRVPVPIPARDGTRLFTLEAPEGIRTVTLASWLDGKSYTKSLNIDDARDLGGVLAALHRAGAGFASAHARPISNATHIAQHMPALADMLAGQSADRAFYIAAGEAVRASYAAIDPAKVPAGPVHGDFQFANVLKDGEGRIGALDFDTCGEGFLAEDIFTFVWRADMEIGDPRVVEAFLAGYNAVRPLSAGEAPCLPLFRAARDLVMCTAYAILINRVGPVSGFEGDFAAFTAQARRHLKEAGL